MYTNVHVHIVSTLSGLPTHFFPLVKALACICEGLQVIIILPRHVNNEYTCKCWYLLTWLDFLEHKIDRSSSS